MTKIIEIMPDGVSDEIASAIAEGRLCRYAMELEGEIKRLKAAHIWTDFNEK